MRGIPIACALAVSCSSPPPRAPSPPPPPPPVVHAPAPPLQPTTRIAALTDGALVIDADSGLLVKTDRTGAVVARLAIGSGAGTLAYDPARGIAFVADRAGDHVVAVDASTLAVRARFATPVEPFGVALSPDRATLYVTTIADRTFVALDAATGAVRWQAPLSYQPRAIAVSPDGTRALVAAGGALDDIALDGDHAVHEIAVPLDCDHCAEGPAFARATGLVFLDANRAIASFQREVPDAIVVFSTGVYGGSSRPPITQHLDFLSFDPADPPHSPPGQVVAQIAANDPRSLVWDGPRDTLWVGGFASDAILRLARLTGATTDETEGGASSFSVSGADRCGPDGLAEATDGTMYLWCGLSRRVVRIPAGGAPTESAPLAESSLTEVEHRGMVLFQSTQHGINSDHAIACATCHVDGKSDGHSWRIHKDALQTPNLAGRIPETSPYKWTGTDATIEASIASTIHRLGGAGLNDDDTAALAAYLRGLPHPRVPTLDASAIARGKAVFEGAGGCTECHGGTQLTDRKRHKLDGAGFEVDTPSLVGLASSAPYYHDGSAPDLHALVSGAGAIRGMGNLSGLNAAQQEDLAAYLASL